MISIRNMMMGGLFLLCSTILSGQFIDPWLIDNSGRTFTNGDLSLDWTLGEAFVADYSSGGFQLSLGFLQSEHLEDLPDLIVESIELDQSSYLPGEQFGRATITIRNQGAVDLDGTIISKVYISADTTFDVGTDFFLDSTFLFGGLAVDSSGITDAFYTVPENIPPGEYSLLVVADSPNSIEESVETNNTSTIPVTILDPLTTRPDLIVQEVTLAANVYKPGDFITADFSVVNQGNVPLAALISIKGYLSTDTTLDEMDILVDSSSLFSVDVDSSAERLLFFELPMNVEDGNYFLLVHVDDPNLVDELDEMNNIGLAPLQVQSEIVDLPDITGSNFTVEETQILPGDELIRVDYTVDNQGMSDISSFFSNALYLSPDDILDENDEQLNSSTMNDLQAGSSADVFQFIAISDSTSPGDYTIILSLDDDQDIEEADESNNLLVQAVKVSDPNLVGPDLIVSDLHLASDQIFAGQQALRLEFMIRNIGNAASAGLETVRIYLSEDDLLDDSDEEIGSALVDALEGGSDSEEAIFLALPETLLPGAYTIIVRIDDDEALEELNEENNDASTTLEVIDSSTMGPDLVVDSIDLVRNAVFPEDDLVRVNFCVQNIGNLPTEQVAIITLFLSEDERLDQQDVEVGIGSVGALAADSVARTISFITIPETTTPGDYTLIIQIDSDNNIPELNEMNNHTGVPIQILDPSVMGPDLLIGMVTIERSEFFPGDQFITLEFEVQNLGNINVDQLVNTRIYLSTDDVVDENDEEIGSSFVFDLAPDSTADKVVFLDIPDSIPPGSYKLILKVDGDDALPELDEENNTASIMVRVLDPTTEAPDLVAEEILSEQDTFFPGDRLNWELITRNDGFSPVFAARGNVFLSEDDMLDRETDTNVGFLFLDTIPAGQADTSRPFVTLPEDLVPGEYHLFVCLDDRNELVELNEENNCIARGLTVASLEDRPDLVIDDMNVPFVDWFAGDVGEIDICISNPGRFRARQALGRTFLSSDEILDDNDITLGFIVAPTIPSEDTVKVSTTISIPEETAPGSYFIIGDLDVLGLVNETDEMNNSNFTAFIVQDPSQAPDLTIITANAPDEPRVADSIRLSVDVQNLGLTDAKPSLLIAHLTKLDTFNAEEAIFLGSKNVDAVSHSRSGRNHLQVIDFTGFIRRAVEPGEWNILFRADGSNRLTELDETNNSLVITVTVQDSISTSTEYKSINGHRVILYPNPVTAKITLETDFPSSLHYVIYSAEGTAVSEGKWSKNEQIEVSDVVPGKYWMVLTDKPSQKGTVLGFVKL